MHQRPISLKVNAIVLTVGTKSLKISALQPHPVSNLLLPTLLTLLQPHKLSCCVLKTPGTLQPASLCSGQTFCLECFSLRHLHNFLISCKDLLKCNFSVTLTLAPNLKLHLALPVVEIKVRPGCIFPMAFFSF